MPAGPARFLFLAGQAEAVQDPFELRSGSVRAKFDQNVRSQEWKISKKKSICAAVAAAAGAL